MTKNLLYNGFNSELVYKNLGGLQLKWYHFISGSHRALPSFFIVGAQKSGTTTLLQHLVNHPQIEAPNCKETFYFNDINNFKKGQNWYQAHFPLKSKLNSNKYTIDGSANFFESIDAPLRIKQLIPKAKVILLLRNPVDRAYSHYKMAVKYGFEKLSFEEALEIEDKRLQYEQDEIIPQLKHPYIFQKLGYRTKGIYVNYLSSWMNNFNEESLLIIKAEEYFTNPKENYQNIINFLQLNDFQLNSHELKNKGDNSQMKDATRIKLTEFYKPYNQQLSELLGKQFSW
jgi:Sulfotransferase domain